MTVPKNLRQKGEILDENIFLKTKSFPFSLLCLIHMDLAYQNDILLSSDKYDWFWESKFLHKIYALQIIPGIGIFV